jgi:hypothetical protein
LTGVQTPASVIYMNTAARTAALLEHLLAEHNGAPEAELREMTYAELVAEHKAECAVDAEFGRPCPTPNI